MVRRWLEVQILVGSNHTTRYVYQCPDHKAKLCSTKSINADYIENVVLECVVEILENNPIATSYANKISSKIAYENAVLLNHNRVYNELSEKFNALVLKSTQNTNSILGAVIDKQINDLAEQITEYEKKITHQQERINELTCSQAPTITKELLLANRAQTRQIIRYIISSIEIDDSNGDISIEIN